MSSRTSPNRNRRLGAAQAANQRNQTGTGSYRQSQGQPGAGPGQRFNLLSSQSSSASSSSGGQGTGQGGPSSGATRPVSNYSAYGGSYGSASSSPPPYGRGAAGAGAASYGGSASSVSSSASYGGSSTYGRDPTLTNVRLKSTGSGASLGSQRDSYGGQNNSQYGGQSQQYGGQSKLAQRLSNNLPQGANAAQMLPHFSSQAQETFLAFTPFRTCPARNLEILPGWKRGEIVSGLVDEWASTVANSMGNSMGMASSAVNAMTGQNLNGVAASSPAIFHANANEQNEQLQSSNAEINDQRNNEQNNEQSDLVRPRSYSTNSNNSLVSMSSLTSAQTSDTLTSATLASQITATGPGNGYNNLYSTPTSLASKPSLTLNCLRHFRLCDLRLDTPCLAYPGAPIKGTLVYHHSCRGIVRAFYVRKIFVLASDSL